MKLLYKYVHADTAERILNSKSIRITNPIQFNDPFDCNIPHTNIGKDLNNIIHKSLKRKKSNNQLLHKHELAQFNKELKAETHSLNTEIQNINKELSENWEKLISTLRILSMSTESNNTLMWSHYANHHSGAVLGFKKCRNNFLENSNPVTYKTRPTKIKKLFNSYFSQIIKNPKLIQEGSLSTLMDNALSAITLELLTEYFYIKKNDWKYEKEYRLILPESSSVITSINGIDTINFNATDLKTITLGIKMHKSEEDKIKRIILSQYPNTKIFKLEKLGWDITPIIINNTV